MSQLFFRVGALVSALAVGAVALFSLNLMAGARVVKEPFKGSCAPVSGIAGPEDMQIDAHSRRVFIASYDRQSSEAKERGGVFVFSIDDPLADGAWRDRTGGAPASFEPVGLSLYDDGAVRRLFVANAAARSVELYDVEPNGDLRYLETFSERRLTSPSDIVAVGPRAFYVTNDLDPGRDSLLGAAQYLFRAASGRVMLFDGVAWRVAAEGLRFASGIATSLDGKRVYVTETAGAALKVYDRDIGVGNLTLASSIPLAAAADNINIDPTGTLWIGAQPKTLFSPARKGSKAGSIVFGYDDLGDLPSRPRAIFTDSGEKIAGATVAARLGRALLIGSPAEKKFQLCEVS
ncbi:MAG: hypothetical protein ABL957_13970 [Parvularculaceae bacterium]